MLNLTKDKRKSLGSFYTPDSLADKMVSKFESLDGNFVDFTAGDGSLLRALNRAGVDWSRLYANELDKDSYENLLKMNPDLPRDHVLSMDALDDDCHKKMLEITNGQYQVILNPPFHIGGKIVAKILEWVPE